MKFALGGISHESNTFCPEKTTLRHFKLAIADEIVSENKGTHWFFGGVIDTAEELGVMLVPTLSANASPYGLVERKTFNFLSETLYERLENAGKVDGVMLILHGGMVAENCLDPEGEILANVRDILGAKTPIVCTLDMHCNISTRMVDNANAFFVNNENPHLDSYDRAVEATKALYRIVKKEIEPVMALRKPGMLPPTLLMNPPHAGPLVELFNTVFKMEEDPRVINVNIGAGFPWSDVPNAGMSVLIVVDKERELAETLADDLSQRLWEVRHEFIPSLMTVDEAVEKSMQADKGPVILVDVADNPGDGTTEDSNGILEALMRRGVEDVGFALIHDPEAVEQCICTGVGNRVTLDLGCKARRVGEPLKVTGTVKTLSDGVFSTQDPLFGRHQVSIGRVAVVVTKGIEIIISEQTYPPNDPEVFRRHGIDPSRMKILVVKTFRMHMGLNYRSFAKEIIEVDAPGQASPNLKRFTWTQIPRPMFPIDDI